MPASSRAVAPRVDTSYNLNVFALLLALRVANALVVRTFFQPDEYFQSLEPAWHVAYGDRSGAWITWEWRNQLRSSLHPLLFAAVYRVASTLAAYANVSIETRSQILLAAPKVTQAFFAAGTDYFTFKCAQKVYSSGSRSTLTVLALSIASPWQFFCSIRTFSNSVETALTAAALNYWPWSLMTWSGRDISRYHGQSGVDADVVRSKSAPYSLSGLRLSLLLAAFATVLRPTNVLIWLPLGLITLYLTSNKTRLVLIREVLIGGITAVAVSAAADRWYYGFWTFPPLRFLHFNVAQDLAVFYGRNRRDYYFTEGLPLLLTTALPFSILGAVSGTVNASQGNVARPALGVTALFVVLSLSCIAHKEVRFLYPLLPALLIIAAEPVARLSRSVRRRNKALLTVLFVVNVVIAFYTTQVHQRGVVDVTHFLRQKHEAVLAKDPSALMSVGFLMPCHSTPWRSHLVHSSISGWALTCEPPIEVPLSSRAEYLDEADQFYAGPTDWLLKNLVDAKDEVTSQTTTRPWPDQLAFFEQLLPDIRQVLIQKEYQECWRGFNTHWHDDRRRKGDVLVWCRQK